MYDGYDVRRQGVDHHDFIKIYQSSSFKKRREYEGKQASTYTRAGK
jgi:hypothetical protein